MTLPRGHYCAPKINSVGSRPLLTAFADIATGIGADELASTALLGCYQIELFASASDRDSACGQTAFDNIDYCPVSRKELVRAGYTLSDIACGYSLDHPIFEKIATPICDHALVRLHEKARQALHESSNRTGIISSVDIGITRVRYKLSIVSTGDWLNFDVEALWGQEEHNGRLISRTMAFLEQKLVSSVAPLDPHVRPH